LQYQVPGGAWVTSSMTVPFTGGVASFDLAPTVTVAYRVLWGATASNAVTVAQTAG